MMGKQIQVSRWHRCLKYLLRLILLPFLRMETQDMDALKPDGALIIYFNHTNWVDPLVAAAVFDRDVVLLGKHELFRNPIVRLVLQAYGVIPVRRQDSDLRAFRQALAVLQRGQALVVAPEGTRSHTGTLQQAKAGLVHLALRSQALIQPVAILGCRAIRTNLPRLKRTTVLVKVGKAYRPRPARTRPSHEEMRRLTDEAMCRLAALMPPELRGVYGDAGKGATPYVAHWAANP